MRRSNGNPCICRRLGSDPSSSLRYLASFLLYAVINSALVMSSVGITLGLGPAAAGSGISEVKAFLNGVDVPGIFHFRTLVAKVGVRTA